jgi:hypothetical protein
LVLTGQSVRHRTERSIDRAGVAALRVRAHSKRQGVAMQRFNLSGKVALVTGGSDGRAWRRGQRTTSRSTRSCLAISKDFAGIAAFLASAASDFITGAAIPVDGGFLRGDLTVRSRAAGRTAAGM